MYLIFFQLYGFSNKIYTVSGLLANKNMEKTSIYPRKNEYENELKRLHNAPICPHNKEIILRYHCYMRANRASDQRIIKLSWQLRKLAVILGKPFDEAKKEDIEQVMAVICKSKCTSESRRGKDLSAATKVDYGQVLRQFYRWLKKTGKDLPDEVAWISTKLSTKDSKLNFELITWEDINKCIAVGDNPKDIAFINFIYETGGRIGEVLSMRLRDVVFKKQYARVRLEGKTGERWVPIVTSVPYIAQYLNTHPKRCDSEFLWLSSSDKNKNEPLRYPGAIMLIRKLFKRAGLNKRCNPHSFRHSRATELAKTLTEPQLRLFFGWEKSSDTPSVYTHLSGRDIDNSILALNGLEDKEEQALNKPIACSLCKEINNPGAKFCSKCGYGLSVKQVLDTEEKMKVEIDKTIEYFMKMAKNPELMKKFEEFKSSYGSPTCQ